MSGNPLEFNQDLYVDPGLYQRVADNPVVTGVGNAMDRETLRLVEERAKQLGHAVGSMTLARKELGMDGLPLIDWFPVYYEAKTSVIGDYTFETVTGIEPEHVESAETLIFTRPEFLDLSEADRRLNIMRVYIYLAVNEETLKNSEQRETIALGALLGAGAVSIVSTKAEDGSIKHEYNLSLEEED